MNEELIAIFEDWRWTVVDQRYWCKMWGYGFRGVREPYLYIIENGLCDTFEELYNEYSNDNA